MPSALCALPLAVFAFAPRGHAPPLYSPFVMIRFQGGTALSLCPLPSALCRSPFAVYRWPLSVLGVSERLLAESNLSRMKTPTLPLPCVAPTTSTRHPGDRRRRS